MTRLLESGLINAAMATGLAIVVWLATRAWRHPVFVHTLWIVVLLKLVTPPVVTMPWRFIEPKVVGQASAGTFHDSPVLLAGEILPVKPRNTDELSSTEEES